MYLHIGQERVLPLVQVIAVFDAGLLLLSEEMRQMAGSLRANDHWEMVPIGEAKALVLTDSGIVESSISALTLLRRARLGRDTWEPLAP